MKVVEASRGNKVPRILRDQPEFPVRAGHIWELFNELHGTRRVGPMGGVLPLGWAELYYRQAVTGERLSRSEIELIHKLDAVFLDAEKNPPTLDDYD